MDTSPRQFASAARVLVESGGVVLLQGALALRSRPGLLACEVIDPALPAKPRKWSVVDGSGTDVLELWPGA